MAQGQDQRTKSGLQRPGGPSMSLYFLVGICMVFQNSGSEILFQEGHRPKWGAGQGIVMGMWEQKTS